MSEHIRVLYVDSDEQRRDSFAADIEREYDDVDVRTGSGTDEGFAVLEAEPVECVVSGGSLSDGSGLAFLERVRDERPDLPRILFTDVDEETVVRDAFDVGVTDVLSKSTPAAALVLGRKIHQIVDSRRTGAALQEREAHHDALTRAAADVIVTIDESSTITFVNDAVEETFGYDPETLVGGPLTRLMSDELGQRHDAGLQRYLRSGEKRLDWNYVELTGQHRDGHEVPLGVSFGEFELSGDRYFTGVVRDITDKKQAEDQLRRERDLTERIVQTSPIGIGVVEESGTVTFLNAAAEEILDKTEAEMNDRSDDGPTLDVRDAEGNPVSEAETPLRRIFEDGDPFDDVDFRLERPDGRPVWLSVSGAPLDADDGDGQRVVLTFEDVTDRKRRERQLTALNELGRALTEAETQREVCDVCVDAAGDIVDLPVVSIAPYDEESGRLEPASRSQGATELVGDDPLFGSDRGPHWQAFLKSEEIVCADLDARSDGTGSDTPLRSAIVLPIGRYGVFLAGSADPDAFSETGVELARVLVANAISALDRVDRERALRERKNELEEQTRALERVNRINDVIRGITQELIQASTREQVVQAVCERFTGAEAYRFAWIGSRDAVTGEVVPEAWAGVGDGYLGELATSIEDESAARGPTGRAVRTHEPQVNDNISANPPFEPWRQAALERGYRSSIAVPLVYQESLYGVLNLYATESGMFGEMEQAVLAELGETIGYALNAINRKQALVSEQSVELEFRIGDVGGSLLGLADEVDDEFEFRKTIQRADGSVQLFFTVQGVPPDEVTGFAERSADVERVTLVAERDENSLYECTVDRSAFLSTLLDRGAVLQHVSATGTDGRVVVRVPHDTDIRTFAELFAAEYDDASLVARREVDEPIKSQQGFEAEFRDQLTERQEEVLQTAFFAGFFEDPRESTAQEIADILGVSQPTVSRHVRAGERALFSMLFEEG